VSKVGRWVAESYRYLHRGRVGRPRERPHPGTRGDWGSIVFGVPLAVVLCAPPGHSQPSHSPTVSNPGSPSALLCIESIHAAELRYRLPPGLLLAISQVESGRPDSAANWLEPWPWTVQAEDHSIYFDSKSSAVHWVRNAIARGVASIDAGCLQVNLLFHPRAFRSLDDAFDPRSNADYAARFLRRLYAATGDWRRATGLYHSQTTTLATLYEARVSRMLGNSALTSSALLKSPTLLDRLADAWRATLRNGLATSEHLAGNDWNVLIRATLIRHARSVVSR
jgi:hypothetical protein